MNLSFFVLFYKEKFIKNNTIVKIIFFYETSSNLF